MNTDTPIKSMQRLRLQRFGMSLATYAVVILATVLVTHIGLGRMNWAQWTLYLGLALFGNGIFFILFTVNGNLRFSDPSLTREQILFSGFWGMVALHALPEARPIVLMFYIPAFSFGMLRLTRRQYFAVAGCVLAFYATVLGLEFIQGRREFNIRYELFLFALFGILLTWFAFFGGFVSNIRHRLKGQKEELLKAHEDIRAEMETRRSAEIEKDNLIVELQHAVSRVKTLSGLLPICAHCKKIRDDKGYWNQIENYIHEHSNVEFSHGICKECAEKYYPEMGLYRDDEG